MPTRIREMPITRMMVPVTTGGNSGSSRLRRRGNDGKHPGRDHRAVDAEQADIGAAAIDSIGPTEANVTPIITGSRIPTPGKPIHCTNVAMPQANKSALIRKATSSGGSFKAGR